MNNLHSDHDLYQAVLLLELRAFSWCWEETRGAQRSFPPISFASVAVFILGAGQESLSPRDVSNWKEEFSECVVGAAVLSTDEGLGTRWPYCSEPSCESCVRPAVSAGIKPYLCYHGLSWGTLAFTNHGLKAEVQSPELSWCVASCQATVIDWRVWALGEVRQKGVAPGACPQLRELLVALVPKPGLQRWIHPSRGKCWSCVNFCLTVAVLWEMRQGSLSRWCRSTYVYSLKQLAAYPSTNLMGKTLMKQLSADGSSHCVSWTHFAHLSALERRGWN